MKVLIITSEWPNRENPNYVPFLVEQIKSLRVKGLDATVYNINSQSFLFRIKSILDLRNHICSTAYQIIHIHWGYNGLYCLGCGNVPTVLTLHGSDLNKPIHWTFKTIIIYFISRISTLLSDHNIFVNRGLSERVKTNNSMWSIIPVGIDLNKFYPMNQRKCREKLNLPLDKSLVLFGGNSSQPVKRIELAEMVIETLGNDFSLITLNYEDHKLIPYYMNAVDLLLMVSINEGSPTMIKEALASDLPVVSTNVGDVKELIDGIDNCHIIWDESVENISNTIKLCIGQARHRNGRSKMEKKYSLGFIADQLIEVYDKVTDNLK